MPGEVVPPEGLDREMPGQAQRAYGVPNADEADAGLIVRMRLREAKLLHRRRIGAQVFVTIDIVGCVAQLWISRTQDPDFGDQPDETARREGAAAEPEDVNFVTGLITRGEELEPLLHVLGKAPPGRQAGKLPDELRADTVIVKNMFRSPRVV